MQYNKLLIITSSRNNFYVIVNVLSRRKHRKITLQICKILFAIKLIDYLTANFVNFHVKTNKFFKVFKKIEIRKFSSSITGHNLL